MKIEEKDIEDYLFKNYNNIKELSGDYIIRQLKLPGYGRLDLLVIKIEQNIITIKIIEIKKELICLNTLGQISKYYSGIKRSIDKLNIYKDNSFLFIYELILIGSGLSDNDNMNLFFNVLENRDEFNFIDNNIIFISYEFSIENGIKFKRENGFWYKNKEKTLYKLEKYIKKALTNKKNENINKNAIRSTNSKRVGG